jgi:pyruvate ferredoxin oxidoreductase alpha subunit
LVRPWPASSIADALAGRRAVAVIDQNLSPGLGGILFQETAGAVVERSHRPIVLRSFVGGLGGKDISDGELRHVVDVLERAEPGDGANAAELLYTEADRQQVARLQGIAGVEETAS